MTGTGKFNSRTLIASKRLRSRTKKANRIQKKLAQLQLQQQLEEQAAAAVGNQANDDDLGVVIVCEPTFDEFCIQFCHPNLWNNVVSQTTRSFTVSIPEFHQDDGFVVYSIQLCTGGKTFGLKKRYSDFSNLASQLKRNQLIELWDLPPKTWFPTYDGDFLQERRIGLEKSLLNLLSTDSACKLPLIRDFLHLDMLHAEIQEEKTLNIM